jgi:hypothetical protein
MFIPQQFDQLPEIPPFCPAERWLPFGVRQIVVPVCTKSEPT